MNLKKARQMLKSLAEDTRMRIVNLLNKERLTVTDICRLLNKSQPAISKHLTHLRLTGIVGDERKGMSVHYFLLEPREREHRALLNVVIYGLKNLEIFKKDLEKLKNFKQGGVR